MSASLDLLPLIDIGVNLINPRLLKRVHELIPKALEASVKGMILTGTDPKNSLEYLPLMDQLTTAYPSLQLWSTAGVHPHDSTQALEANFAEGDWLTQIRKAFQSHQYVIAVGECGLDYERNYSEPKIQRQVFERQIELAIELQKPLFLHQRGAQKDFINIMSNALPDLLKRGDALAAVVHCFTDDRDCLEALLGLGCYIGITAWIADERRGQNLREAVSYLPLNRVLIETDAPYLLPRTLRPKPKSGLNEPAYLPHIIEQLAFYMKTDVSTLRSATLQNTETLFGIKLKNT